MALQRLDFPAKLSRLLIHTQQIMNKMKYTTTDEDDRVLLQSTQKQIDNRANYPTQCYLCSYATCNVLFIKPNKHTHDFQSSQTLYSDFEYPNFRFTQVTLVAYLIFEITFCWLC